MIDCNSNFVSRDKAAEFCREVEELEGSPAWIIGTVEEGVHGASIVQDPTVLDV